MRGSLGRRRCSQGASLAQATTDGAAALAAWTAGWRSEDGDSGLVRADLTLLGGGISMGSAGLIWAPQGATGPALPGACAGGCVGSPGRSPGRDTCRRAFADTMLQRDGRG
jgi:hypothetical protein